MKICVLIGSPNISGGTYVIYQHCLYLQKQNWDVTIVALEEATEDNVKWHPDALKELTFKTYTEVENEIFDICMVTWWKTCFEMNRIKTKRYIYFVQSIESLFYNEEEKPLRKLVNSTYTHNLPVITEATWIKKYLENNYNSTVKLALNGIRKDIYSPIGEAIEEKNNNKLRVLVEGPLNVPFKNIKKTLQLCLDSKADEIWFLTIDDVTHYKGIDRVFSKLPITEVPKLYRSCDVIVKLSYVEGMFGPPLEMFHCGGTTIVYDVTGHDEYIVHKKNGLVVKTDNDKQVIKYINKLVDDREYLNKLKEGALQTANEWPNWEQSSKVFMENLVELTKLDTNSSLMIEGMKDSFATYVTEENKRLEEEKLKKGKTLTLYQKIKKYIY